MTVKNCVKSRYKVESVGQRYQNRTVDKLNYDWLLYFNPGPRVCLTLFRLRASVWCEEVGSRPGRFAKFPVFFSVRLPLPGFPAKDCANAGYIFSLGRHLLPVVRGMPLTVDSWAKAGAKRLPSRGPGPWTSPTRTPAFRNLDLKPPLLVNYAISYDLGALFRAQCLTIWVGWRLVSHSTWARTLSCFE